MAARAIADLPELSEFVPGAGAAGFSADYSELFGRTEARLLRNVPRENIPGASTVVAFRNKDLLELAANSAAGMLPPEYHRFSSFFRHMIFATNPPIHGPLRQVIARPLMPKHVPSFNELARRIARELINELAERGEVDFCSQFSDRLTARFWGALFEMTQSEIEELIEIVRQIVPVFLIGSTEEESSIASAALDSYTELVARAIQRALDRGGNALLETMAAAFNAVEGESKPPKVAHMIAANAIEGIHTAAVAISNVIYQLLLCPQELAAVREDLKLASNAVTEGLRLWPPFRFLERYALQDIELAETFIPRGTSITMIWGAGNRDPAVFEHPNRYDLSRKPRADTTFGGGVHICPGRYVARMLAQVSLETVLAPDVRIELTGERPTWLPAASVQQLSRMLVTIRRC